MLFRVVSSSLGLLLVLTTGAVGAPLRLTGALVDERGEPLPGARIALRLPPDTHAAAVAGLAGQFDRPLAAEARSDARGRYLVVAPTPGLYEVIAEARGRVGRLLGPVAVLEERELPPVALVPDLGLVVTLVDESDRPLRDVALFALAEDPKETAGVGWRALPDRRKTDAEGRVLLSRGALHRVSLSAFVPGYAELARTGLAAATTLRVGPRDAGRLVEVVVDDGAGAALADVVLRIGARSWPVARTDAAGRARVWLPVTDEGPLRLSTADGRLGATPVPAASTRIVVSLPPSPVLSGAVRDANTGAPLAGALVWALATPGRPVWTDAAGRYQLIAPEGSVFRLRAEAPGRWGSGARVEAAEIRARRAPTLALGPAASLLGQVVDDRGVPLPEVTLEAGTGSARQRAVAVDRATSGPDGRFRFVRLRPGELYEVRGTKRGHLPAALEAVTPTSPRLLPGLRLVLPPSRSLSGRVEDAQARPVAGAEVLVRKARGVAGIGRSTVKPLALPDREEPGLAKAVTDAAGRFVIPEAPGTEVDLFALAPGFVPVIRKNLRATVAKQPWDAGKLVLVPGAPILGRVVDPEGHPIAGAAIHRLGRVESVEVLEDRLDDSDAEAVSDATGRFELPDLAVGKPVQLFVRAEGFLAGQLDGVRPPTAEPVAITLVPGAKLVGRVVAEDGEPVPAMEISLSWQETLADAPEIPAGRQVHRQAKTDALGRFEIPDAPRGRVVVGGEFHGFVAPPPMEVELPLAEGEELWIELRRGASLEGRVATTRGKPVAGVRLVVAEAAAVTDAEGFYRLEGLRPGGAELDVFHPAYPRLTKRVEIDGSGQRLDVELPAGEKVAGRVLDAAGEPVSAAEVTLETPQRAIGRRDHRARTAPDGGFELEAVPRGRYRVVTRARGYALSFGKALLEVPENGRDDLEIVLARGGRLLGTVSGLDPDQLSRVEVRAENDDFDESVGGLVDGAGRFEIPDLAPGDWQLVGTLPGEQREVTARVVVAPGATVERDLEFGGRFTLAGRIFYGGEPLAGARVSVRASRYDLEHTLESDYRGEFRLEDLAADTYWLGVSHRGQRVIHNDTVELVADRQMVIELDSGVVLGEVTSGATGKPVQAAVVRLEPVLGAEFVVAAGVDAEGHYRLPRVPPGSYRASVAAEGHAPFEKTVEVVGDRRETRLDVELAEAPGLELAVRLDSGSIPRLVALRVEDELGRLVLVDQEQPEPSGTVRLGRLPPGRWRLTVSAPGAAAVELDVRVPGAPPEVVLLSAAPVSLRLPALAESDRLAVVTVTSPDGQPLRRLGPGAAWENQWPLVAGRSTIPEVPAGRWRIDIAASDGRQWSVEMVADGRHRQEIQID